MTTTWEETAPEALRYYLSRTQGDITSAQCWRAVGEPRREPTRQEQMWLARWLRYLGYGRISVRVGSRVHRVWRRSRTEARVVPPLERPGTRAATEVKRWLRDMDWGQAEACRNLQVTEYAMRGWLNGHKPVPLIAQLAMRWLRDHKHEIAISVTSTPHSGVDTPATVCSDTSIG